MADAGMQKRIGSTCQYTAALRYVETTQVNQPLVVDHLAAEICGEAAMQLALKELQDLQAAQGVRLLWHACSPLKTKRLLTGCLSQPLAPVAATSFLPLWWKVGKHLRVPARTRILEDWLLQEITNLPSTVTEVQVVSLGSGLDTRPWRIAFPTRVHWICMDFPDVMAGKHDALKKARAQLRPRAAACAAPDEGVVWPLNTSSWHGLGLDLSKISNSQSVEEAISVLEEALLPTGFNKLLPTFWVIEAVLYYMPLDRAEVLLGALAAISRPSGHSALIATCVDNELLEASRNLEAGHIFSQLWYFDIDGLLGCSGYKQNWVTKKEPRTTKALAQELYGADTYVALYGGAECAFLSHLSH